MNQTPEPIRDRNTRGLGLALRLTGALLPPAVFFAVLFAADGEYETHVSHHTLSSVFKVVAFLWAWPFGMWRTLPLSFGALAVWGLLMSGVILIRRDSRGAATVLAFAFVWGWLLSAIVWTARGS